MFTEDRRRTRHRLARHRVVGWPWALPTGAGLAIGCLVTVIALSIGLYVIALAATAVAVLDGARLVWPSTSRGRVRTTYGRVGWATARDLRRSTSAGAIRRLAPVVRPSALTLPETVRARLEDAEFGTYVGRSVVGPLRGRDLYCSHRDVALIVAPPQTGKTGWLAAAVRDFPGAVVSTSTKADVLWHVARARRARGPVLVFNPEQVGGIPSTFRWSPVDGCHEPSVAQERASAMVSATQTGESLRDGQFFAEQGAVVLRAYLLAAALSGRGMDAVAGWVNDPDDQTALKELARHRVRVPPGWERALAQVAHTRADRTRESIYLTLALATAFMGDPEVARVVCPAAAEPRFDVENFIACRGTLFLIGAERGHGSIAPLLAALTDHVFETSKRLAARLPHGRLDPALMLALDEAALIAPVPLDRWTADAGGRGIHILIAVQSPSQLAQRWGERGAETITNNANLRLYYGGLGVERDLEAISRLCGSRDEPAISDSINHGGDRRSSISYSTRVAPVLPPDGLRTLPPWHVLVLYRSSPPTIARVRLVWSRQRMWPSAWTTFAGRVTYWRRRLQLMADRRLGR